MGDRYDPTMPGIVEHLARALVETHGSGAIAFAEQALCHVRSLGMSERAKTWEQVIIAIRAMQEASEHRQRA
jgi:hypothetical protein